MHDRDDVGDLAHEAHVVLDHDQRVRALAKLLNILAVFSISLSVMPAIGSSISSSRGSCISTMPISSHWVSPCERMPAALVEPVRQPGQRRDLVELLREAGHA